MSDTKACNLTEEEIVELLHHHGQRLGHQRLNTSNDISIERINYLNKRLKAFKEVELTDVKSTNTAAGWGSND